jgi:hypothetical protein
MNIDDWLQWPMKSTDPGVNFVVLIALIFVGITLVVVGGMFLLPVVLVIGIAKGCTGMPTGQRRPTSSTPKPSSGA